MQSEMAAMSSCSVLLELISMGDIQAVYAIEGLGTTRPNCEKSPRSRGGDIKETNCLVYDSHLIYSFVNIHCRFKEPLW